MPKTPDYPRRAEIFSACMGPPKRSYADVGREFGISRQRVAQIIELCLAERFPANTVVVDPEHCIGTVIRYFDGWLTVEYNSQSNPTTKYWRPSRVKSVDRSAKIWQKGRTNAS